jgi:hypothetical protein
MRCRKFISLFGGVAAAWWLEAHAQESATMPETNATRSTLPQITERMVTGGRWVEVIRFRITEAGSRALSHLRWP